MFCGLPPASSVIETAAVLLPVAVGVKVTVTVQLLFAKTSCPHVVVMEKSPGFAPTITKGLKTIVVVPTSVMVTVSGVLDVPTFVVGKTRLGGPKLSAVPVPDKVTVCGLARSLSLIATLALLGPPTPGPKVTVIVQLAPAARVEVQVVV